MRQRRSTKILSLLLSLTMVLGMFTGTTAFAAGDGETYTYVLHPYGLKSGMEVPYQLAKRLLSAGNGIRKRMATFHTSTMSE